MLHRNWPKILLILFFLGSSYCSSEEPSDLSPGKFYLFFKCKKQLTVMVNYTKNNKYQIE